MTAPGLPFCDRCGLLDGDPYGRTCLTCRTAEREAAAEARRRIEATLAAAPWHTTAGEVIAAQIVNEAEARG